MKLRNAKSQTADLFAAANASTALVPLPATPQPAGSPRSRQLWYAVVFPELIEAKHSATVLQPLCMHAQQFTSFVSIELPNALLLEIKGSVKLFGSLKALHVDIDACWRRLALPARSATAGPCLAPWRRCSLPAF